MESLSGKPFLMMVQSRQYWIADYSSLFLWGVSIWQFFSNSLMWPFLIIVSDIFGQDISNS